MALDTTRGIHAWQLASSLDATAGHERMSEALGSRVLGLDAIGEQSSGDGERRRPDGANDASKAASSTVLPITCRVRAGRFG
jgi:hypothetical protein